jgi:hypothetical protein
MLISFCALTGKLCISESHSAAYPPHFRDSRTGSANQSFRQNEMQGVPQGVAFVWGELIGTPLVAA